MQRLKLVGGSEQVQSLIRTVSRSLIESLSNTIGMLIVSNPDDLAKDSAHADDSVRLSAQEMDLVDLDYLEANARDIKAEIQNNVNKVINDKIKEALAGRLLDEEVTVFPRMSKKSHVLVNYMQASITSKYHARGLGMSVTKVEGGVSVEFALSELLQLDITVSAAGGDLEVRALLHYKEQGEDKAKESKKVIDLVQSAVTNMLAAVKADLQEINLEQATDDQLAAKSSSSASAASDTSFKPTVGKPSAGPVPTAPAAVATDAPRSKASNLHLETTPTPSEHTEKPFTSIGQPPSTSGSAHAPAAKATAPGKVLDERSFDSTDSVYEALRSLPSVSVDKASKTSNGRKPFRDPEVLTEAIKLGVRVEKFEKGMEFAAAKELNNMLRQSRMEGFLSVFRPENQTISPEELTKYDVFEEPAKPTEEELKKTDELKNLFATGKSISQLNVANILDRPSNNPYELSAAELALEATRLFEDEQQQDPAAAPAADNVMDVVPEEEDPYITKLSNLKKDAVYVLEKERLYMLIGEMKRSDSEMHPLILDGFRDLLLSDYFLLLMKEANDHETEMSTRLLYRQIIEKSILLHTEVAMLMKSEAMRHLKLIEEVCAVASQYSDDSLSFLDAMDVVKQRFDTTLLSYLKYAIKEEEQEHIKEGIDPHSKPGHWLQVLRIIRRGVIAELQSHYELLLDCITFVLRFHDFHFQSELFGRIVAKTATKDLYHMRTLCMNMVKGVLLCQDEEHIAAAIRNDTRLPEKMEKLYNMTEEHLSEEYMRNRNDVHADEVKEAGQEIHLRHRDPIRQTELEAADFDERKNMLRMGGRTEYDSAHEGDDMSQEEMDETDRIMKGLHRRTLQQGSAGWIAQLDRPSESKR